MAARNALTQRTSRCMLALSSRIGRLIQREARMRRWELEYEVSRLLSEKCHLEAAVATLKASNLASVSAASMADIWETYFSDSERGLIRSIGAPLPWRLKDDETAWACTQCAAQVSAPGRRRDFRPSSAYAPITPRNLHERYEPALRHARWHQSLGRKP